MRKNNALVHNDIVNEPFKVQIQMLDLDDDIFLIIRFKNLIISNNKEELAV